MSFLWFCKRSCFLSCLDLWDFLITGLETAPALTFWDSTVHGIHPLLLGERRKRKKLAELISWTHKNEQIGVSFGWANHSLTYKALGHEESPLFPSRRFSSNCDACGPVLSVTGLVNVKLFWHVCLKGLQWLCWNYRMEVRNKAAKSVIFWKNTTRFEESVISEWDDSTGLGMKRVSVLE